MECDREPHTDGDAHTAERQQRPHLGRIQRHTLRVLTESWLEEMEGISGHVGNVWTGDTFRGLENQLARPTTTIKGSTPVAKAAHQLQGFAEMNHMHVKMGFRMRQD